MPTFTIAEGSPAFGPLLRKAARHKAYVRVCRELTAPPVECDWCGDTDHESYNCHNRDPFAIETWNAR